MAVLPVAHDRLPSWMYWMTVTFNVLVPWLFLFKKIRTSYVFLFCFSLLINVGMWFERLFIIFTSLVHDFLPQNWGSYQPTWVELSITLGAFGFFSLWFFGFSKFLPTIPLSELKTRLVERETSATDCCQVRIGEGADTPHPSVMAIFSNAGRVLEAVKGACDAGYRDMETFSPVKLEEVERVMRRPKSPVRFWTLAGALAGLAGGFWLAIGTAQVNNLIVGASRRSR